MAACAQCLKLVDGKCAAFPVAQRELGRDLNPIGACVIPIVEGYLQLIEPGMRVLEIGCGSWDALARRCREVGAGYEAIDTQAYYFDKPTVATRLENLRDLSFEDGAFDLVVGNQTMEHWAEHGCPIGHGLYQCFRVCKSRGRVLLNVPIHFHGTRDFLLGDMESIRARFAPFSTDVRFDVWRHPSYPLPPFLPHQDYGVLRGKAAYVLAIDAVADKAVRKRRFMLRLPTQVLRTASYPVSFNLVRAARKARALLRR